MANTQTNKINPFYIEPTQQEDEEDEWAWEDDTDDLEELLGDGDEDQRHPTAQQYHSVGGLPVRNLAYDSNSRLRYIFGALIVVILLISLVSTGGGSGPPSHTSLGQHDSIDDTKKKPRIVVMGERNSGVPWVEHSLNVCFPNATVSHTLQRGGYFFQDEIDMSDQEIHVVVVALNPYDWVQLMRTHPQNMPNHAGIEDWKHFVEMEWTMDRPERDFVVKGKPGKVCQQDFEVNQVISCLPTTEGEAYDNPIYELKRDGSGDPFASILELRAEKFRNHIHQVSQWVDSLTIVKYEDLVADTKDSAKNSVPGIFDVMQAVASQSDLTWSCSFRKAPAAGSEETLPPDFVSYINENVDWDAEALFGYVPLPSKSDDDKDFTDDDDDTIKNADDDHLPEGVTYPPTASPTDSAAEADTAVPTAAPTEAKVEEQTPSPTKGDVVATESPTLTESDEILPTLAPINSDDDGKKSKSGPTDESNSGKDDDSTNDYDDDSFDDDKVDDDDSDEENVVDDDDEVDGDDDEEDADDGKDAKDDADSTPPPTAATPKKTSKPTMLETSSPTNAPTTANKSAPTKEAKTSSPTASAKKSKDDDANQESNGDVFDKDTKKDEQKDSKPKKDKDSSGNNDSDEGKDEKKKDDKSDKKSSIKKKDDDKDEKKKNDSDADDGETKKKKDKHHKKKDGEKNGEKHKHKESDESKGKDDGEKKDKDKKKDSKKKHHDDGGDTDSDKTNAEKSGGDI
jgi:hypothetical protein